MTAFVHVNNSGTQHLTANQVSTGSSLVSDPIDMTGSGGANHFVVAVGYYPHQGGQDTKLLTGVTDSQGNHYSRIQTRTGANNNLTSTDVIETWATDGSSVSNSLTMTFTATFAGATFASISVAGFRAPALPVTVEATNAGFGSGLSLDGGSVTTTGVDRLIVGSGTHTGVTFLAGGFTAGTNMTDCGEYDQSTTTSTSYLNYRLAATAAAYTSPETANGTSNTWGSQTVAFAADSGGGSPSPNNLLLLGCN